jgi:hypothetical protein
MRILIIAMGRSGGHSLLTWIGFEKKHKIIHEPEIDIELIMSKYKNKNDIVVKYHISQIENQLDTFEWNNWDVIIGLIRNDTMECAISQYWSISSNKWRSDYEIDEGWLVENQEKIKEERIKIEKDREIIINIPQIELLVSYENIYQDNTDIEKIMKYLKIEKMNYYSVLDNRYRLRNVNNNKSKRNLI